MATQELKKLLILFKGLVSFIIFIITSQVFTLLIPAPFTHKKKKADDFYTRLLVGYARFVIKTHFNIRVRYINKKKNTFDKPVMIVCNHQSFTDVVVTTAFDSKVCVLNNNWHDNVWARFFLTKYINLFSIYKEKKLLVEELRTPVKMGCPLLIFPEGKMNKDGTISRFHKGGFFVAEKLRMDIQPVVIFYSPQILKKSWFYLKHGDVLVKFLDPVTVESPGYGATYQELTDNVMRLMRTEFKQLSAQYHQGDF
ncbi:MAG TPA: lysophospholipid acyltransferase family protein [Bacteroidales bacterium]|nr:1-acyl-sn-glycerol-3-phosphate acyltransferase [Bacteroidales bacterium]HNZ42668.1 lysophospholipid acyltransferase family protein [Bacteroidales bacterium]HOH84409.1 lysophospholipid acyltransferase family protein [Bacteroidales bacterium]